MATLQPNGCIKSCAIGKRSGFNLGFVRSLNNAHICTSLCTACNALKYIRSSSSGSAKNEVQRSWNYKHILVAGEGICLSTVALPFFIQPNARQLQEQSEASPCLRPPKYVVLPAWQLVPLLLAVFINIILRSLHPQDMAVNKNYGDNLALINRVAKLEEDLLSAITIIRTLTKHVEKLGVRVQVTRRTLRDPLQKAATLAGNMSEAMKALTSREMLIEEELKETQIALAAIQEQQAKQLELIKKVVNKINNLEDIQGEANKERAHVTIDDGYKYDYWLSNNSQPLNR